MDGPSYMWREGTAEIVVSALPEESRNELPQFEFSMNPKVSFLRLGTI